MNPINAIVHEEGLPRFVQTLDVARARGVSPDPRLRLATAAPWILRPCRQVAGEGDQHAGRIPLMHWRYRNQGVPTDSRQRQGLMKLPPTDVRTSNAPLTSLLVEGPLRFSTVPAATRRLFTAHVTGTSYNARVTVSRRHPISTNR